MLPLDPLLVAFSLIRFSYSKTDKWVVSDSNRVGQPGSYSQKHVREWLYEQGSQETQGWFRESKEEE